MENIKIFADSDLSEEQQHKITNNGAFYSLLFDIRTSRLQLAKAKEVNGTVVQNIRVNSLLKKDLFALRNKIDEILLNLK